MITLRPAQLSDYSAIALLQAENWRQNYRGIFSDTFLDYEVDQERIWDWYERLDTPGENQQVIIAMAAENVVGFACLLLNDDPVFGSLLDNLHVSMDWQRAGIGKWLMKECAKIIRDKGSNNKMYLWVYESNQNAINVYNRLGGTNLETIEKQHKDGTKARACRYIWDDVSQLIA